MQKQSDTLGWLCIIAFLTIITALVVSGMIGKTYQEAYDMGRKHGREDVIFDIGTRSIRCVPQRDENDKIISNECDIVYQDYKYVTEKYDYGEKSDASAWSDFLYNRVIRKQ